MTDTGLLIRSLVNTVKERTSLPCYYDRAPKGAKLPYSVLDSVTAGPLNDGDLSLFDVRIWTDDRLPTATEDLEAFCGKVRDAMDGTILSAGGVYAHIGYEGRIPDSDKEDDLCVRRLSFSARVFYTS
ncbi:MAG: hypothetical protein ACI3XR_08565 [Eubacteriales bacterium]